MYENAPSMVGHGQHETPSELLAQLEHLHRHLDRLDGALAQLEDRLRPVMAVDAAPMAPPQALSSVRRVCESPVGSQLSGIEQGLDAQIERAYRLAGALRI